jgi:hypothetical protein
MLYPGHHAQFPLLSQVTFVIAMFGAILVLVGTALAISGVKGWFLSGLYMAAGNAMIRFHIRYSPSLRSLLAIEQGN